VTPDATRRRLLSRLAVRADTRLLLVVIDGLGGLPAAPDGQTELEAAHTPTLDSLAAAGVTGLLTIAAPGITPGSGPGHLALFGFDPLEVSVSRGVLEALGIDVALNPQDVAIRGNLCRVDSSGRVVDRRAGRIGDQRARELLERLRDLDVEGVEVAIHHVAEHRFVVVLHGAGLGADIQDTDPGRPGLAPRAPAASAPGSQRTAQAVQQLADTAARRLAGEPDANMIVLRGAGRRPQLPSLDEAYRLRAMAVARYPMYRGIARLLGMHVLSAGGGAAGEAELLRGGWDAHDFAFVHFKGADRAGEDGDFDAKMAAIETIDAALAGLLEPRPSVVVVTGDHSTPAQLAAHSWHPVPVVLAADTCRPDEQARFGERHCALGGLGHLEAKHLMAIMLAHGGRLAKFDG
jgi:2,3-bisphosphoglycerate-independent phosphoglycerate mutase